MTSATTKKYNTFIFDLDGTLLNTSEGIVKCVEHTISILSLEEIDISAKLNFVGPPLVESFRREFCLSEELAKEAVKVYRQRYSEQGLFEAIIYPGMPEVLKYLKSQGSKILIATLKREDFAVRIMNHFGILDYFDTIVGIDMSDSLTKADTIRIGLQRIGVSSIDNVLMIGDSEYDRIGAIEVGIDFCAVTYGFGFKKGEVIENYTIESPLELINLNI